MLGGEDPIDHVQRKVLGARRSGTELHPLLERIMRIHVTEEARHLSFARHYLRRNVPGLGRIRRAALGIGTPLILGAMAQMMMRPSPTVTRTYEIPRDVLRHAYGSRAAKAEVRASLRKLRVRWNDPPMAEPSSDEPHGPQPTTLMYVFATTWLPTDVSQPQIPTPTGHVVKTTACANLVKCALLELTDRGLVELEMVSKAQRGSPSILGGRSNVRVHPTSTSPAPQGGLEGRLLEGLAAAHPPDGWLARKLTRASGEHHLGVRNILREAQSIKGYRYPWQAIINPLYTEVAEAGLVASEGRAVQHLTVLDEALLAELEPRFAAARARFREISEANPDLCEAIVQDGLVFVPATDNLGD